MLRLMGTFRKAWIKFEILGNLLEILSLKSCTPLVKVSLWLLEQVFLKTAKNNGMKS